MVAPSSNRIVPINTNFVMNQMNAENTALLENYNYSINLQDNNLQNISYNTNFQNPGFGGMPMNNVGANMAFPNTYTYQTIQVQPNAYYFPN